MSSGLCASLGVSGLGFGGQQNLDKGRDLDVGHEGKAFSVYGHPGAFAS